MCFRASRRGAVLSYRLWSSVFSNLDVYTNKHNVSRSSVSGATSRSILYVVIHPIIGMVISNSAKPDSSYRTLLFIRVNENINLAVKIACKRLLR